MHGCGLASSGDGRNNCNRVGLLDQGSVLAQIANIFIVQINIHEGAEFAVLRIEMLAQIGMLSGKIAQGFAHGLGVDFDDGLLSSVRAERRRD
jgi:hypothetical protein